MATRRTFLCGVAAAAASDLTALPAWAATAPPRDRVGVALVDQRFSQSRAFGQRMAERGIATLPFHGDVSKLWLQTLAPQMKRAPVPFAGLTNHGALFCLERWGWEAGMRVMLRVEHGKDLNAAWRHIPAEPIPHALMARLGSSPDGFGVASADLVLESHGAWRDCSHAAPAHRQDVDCEPLVSWIIAPAAQA